MNGTERPDTPSKSCILSMRIGKGPWLESDVSALPDGVKNRIIIAAYFVAGHAGNCDITAEFKIANDALDELINATNAIDEQMSPSCPEAQS